MSLYQSDFLAWTHETAKSIRQNRFTEIDLEKLAEEIESLGRSERHQLTNRLTVLLAHMLKWEFQSGQHEHHGASWQATIREQRKRINRLLSEMPSLQAELVASIADAYESAVVFASAETGIIEEDFPRRCPYSVEEILT